MALNKIKGSVWDAEENIGMVSVADHGAVGDGVTDDTSALQAAISAAATRGISTVYLPAGTYNVSSTIVIDDNNIKIVGENGASWEESAGFNTTIRWVGAAGGTVVQFKTPEGASSIKRYGQGISNIFVDGATLAGVGVELLSVYGLLSDSLTIGNCRSKCLYMRGYVVGQISSSPTNQGHVFNNLLIIVGNDADTEDANGIYLTGASSGDGANTSFCYFNDVVVRKENGVGILIHNADNTYWHGVRIFNGDAADTNGAIEIQGNNAPCGHNYFYGVSAGGYGTDPSIFVKGVASGFSFNPTGNFFMLDNSNGTQLPSLDDECWATVLSDNGANIFPSFIQGAFGSTLAESYIARDALAAQVADTPVLIYGSNNRNMILAGGADAVDQWAVEVADSDLRIRKLAGSGTAVVIQSDIDMGTNTITDTKVGQWDTAFGWGDHAAIGYLTNITGESLSDLSDVTITSIASGELLKWNGTAWVNNTIAEAGLATAAQGGLADSALQDVIDDTTPQLGGDLDLNGYQIVRGAVQAIDIDATGRVLIGPTAGAIGASAGALGVSTGDSGASPWGGADELTVESSGTGGISILTPAANSGCIAFGDPDNNLQFRMQYTHSADVFQLIHDSGEIARFRGDGRIQLGGGGLSPLGASSGAVTISTGDSGVSSANVSADDLIVEGSSHSGISILTPNSVYGSIRFGDPEDNDAAMIRYNHAADEMELLSNNALCFTIESDGVLHAEKADYETLVTDDDDIPNKKYVDDLVATRAGYMIWAEENNAPYLGTTAGAGGDGVHFSFGNGLTNVGIIICEACTVTHLFFNCGDATSVATIELIKNGVGTGATISPNAEKNKLVTLGTPVPFAAGDELNFKTTSVTTAPSVGVIVGCKVVPDA